MEQQQTPLKDDYRDFLQLLNKHGIEYLTVGAYDVMYHGKFVWTSKDMDIWIRQTDENAEKLSNAVFEYSGQRIEPQTLLIRKQKVEIGGPEFKIELITHFERVNFDEAWKNRVQGMFWDVPVTFAPKDGLIEMKKHAGKPHDLADLERLAEYEKLDADEKKESRGTRIDK